MAQKKVHLTWPSTLLIFVFSLFFLAFLSLLLIGKPVSLPKNDIFVCFSVSPFVSL